MPDDQNGAGYPWPAGSATGIGSMPGTDPAEAMRVIAGELPGFPHLPELPARGPGADLTGRTAGLLVDNEYGAAYVKHEPAPQPVRKEVESTAFDAMAAAFKSKGARRSASPVIASSGRASQIAPRCRASSGSPIAASRSTTSEMNRS